MKNTQKVSEKVPYGKSIDAVEAMVHAIIKRENAKCPAFPSGYAYATGLLSALLGDAISTLSAEDGQRFLARIVSRTEEV